MYFSYGTQSIFYCKGFGLCVIIFELLKRLFQLISTHSMMYVSMYRIIYFKHSVFSEPQHYPPPHNQAPPQPAPPQVSGDSGDVQGHYGYL